MKLISMTNFVFLMRENEEKDNVRRFWACERYAKFLKQPLKLEMFITLDVNGNVMNTNSIYDPRSKTGQYYPEEIEEAEEKVLFEGFVINGETVENKNGNRFFYRLFKRKNH